MLAQIFFVVVAAVTTANCQQPGFHAILTTSGAIPANGTIVFDTAPVNIEAGYNPANGIFTCPSPGLYFFHVALKSASLSVFGGSIVYSGSTILASANTKNDGLDMVSMAATIFCNTGDNVYVMGISGTPEVSAPYCTFTGYKILYGPVTP